MLVIHADEFTLDGIADAACHYYGKSYGEVAVVQPRDLELCNGVELVSCVYGFVWTGVGLRQSSDLEAYLFKKVGALIP